MDFFDLIQTRKSIRSFSDRKVSAHDVEKIIAAALYAPSNCNQQLWNFIVITDQEIKERLIAEAASNTLLRKAPVLLVLTYDGWSYKEALQGGSLALGHIVLAATSLGIGSLPMNSYGADSQVKRVLNIPSTERICCFVALGYPDERAEKAPRVPRRPVSETIHWNTFTQKNSPPFTYNPEEWSIEQIADHQRYYCRKTFLGKEMDILNEQERQLVRQSVQKVSGPLVDFLTYDGAYIRELPPVASTCVDLISETSEYSREAARLSCGTVDHINFTTFEALGDEKVNTVSILYKLERIPDAFKRKLFAKSFTILNTEGEMIIVARKSNLLLSLFYVVIQLVFGKELRKTGIYNFFGPYMPISLHKTVRQLREAGFTRIEYTGHFIFPAFYEQVYQMFLQYKKSEGSSYLHREKRVDFITRIIAAVLRMQGLRRVGRLGSVVVITCKK